MKGNPNERTILRGEVNAMITIKILDKQTNRFVEEDDETLFIGLDGKVYEMSVANMGGDVWLSKEDVSSRYGVYFMGWDTALY